MKARGNAEPVRAERFLFDAPLILIRGPAGSGKTTLLNWITWCCAEGLDNPSPWRGGVPFFVPLRSIARTETGAPRVNNFVQYSVDPELWSSAEPDGWVHDVLANQKRAIVMIDGVDELPRSRRAEFWDWLAKFVEDYPENRVIVTSRTLPGSSAADGSDNTPEWNPPQEFVDAHLEEMSNADISSFIEHWHNAVDRGKLDEFEYPSLLRAKEELPKKLEDPANRRIRELCSTPLLCALVCVLHWREEGYLPRQRVDLYSRCCDMLIEARDLKRGVQPPSGDLAYMTKNDKEMVLQRLAFDMMHNKPDGDEVQTSTYRIEISREKALGWITPRIASFQDPKARVCAPEEVLDHLIERTGLLREPAGGLVDFPHRSFQEYLAACAAGGEGQEDFLAKQADDDQWHETIMLAAGTTTGGVTFGRALIDALIKRAERHKSSRPRSQRVRKTCFALALGCLENLRQHNPSLRERVLSHLSELVPPKNDGDARILAVASDAAVPHLLYTDWKDERTSTVAACAQALRLIGTTAAIRALKRGYISDSRDPVVAEVCRTGAINYAKVPTVVQSVSETGRLPHFAEVQDIALLSDLEGLKHLQISAPIPQHIEALGSLHQLSSVNLNRVPLADAGKFPWPSTVESIQLNNCSGSELSWMAHHLLNLRQLSLLMTKDISELSFLDKLTNLEKLMLVGVSISNLSSIQFLHKLEQVTLRQCRHISNLEPL